MQKENVSNLDTVKLSTVVNSLEGGCHCLTSTVLSVWHPSPVYDNANANVKALTLAKECIWEGTFELPTHVSLCLEETPQTRVFVWTC